MKTLIRLLGTVLFIEITSAFAEIDDTDLKGWLLAGFTSSECVNGITRVELDRFRKHSSVANAQLHRVLMAIYREASATLLQDTPETKKRRDNIEAGVVYLLAECGDIPVKEFLLDYAASQDNNALAREFAVASYLRVANAEEAKDILLRFLVREERMEAMSRIGLYYFAREVYEDSSSPDKKMAILDALTSAADKEEDAAVFIHVDRIIAEATATSRGLTLPQAGLQTNTESARVPDGEGGEPSTALPPPHLRRVIPFAVGAGLRAVLFLWRELRKK